MCSASASEAATSLSMSLPRIENWICWLRNSLLPKGSMISTVYSTPRSRSEANRSRVQVIATICDQPRSRVGTSATLMVAWVTWAEPLPIKVKVSRTPGRFSRRSAETTSASASVASSEVPTGISSRTANSARSSTGTNSAGTCAITKTDATKVASASKTVEMGKRRAARIVAA